MAQLSDILIGSTLPLDPRFGKNPRLSLQVIQGERVLKETRAAVADENGIWEIESPLNLPDTNQSLTLVVIANTKGSKRRLVSATIRVADICERLKTVPNEHYELITCDSCASLQVIVSCSIKRIMNISGTLLSQAVADATRYLADKVIDRNEQNSTPEELYRRELLRDTYANFAYSPNSEAKVQILSIIGRDYHALYQQSQDVHDLDNAISIQGEAVNIGYFHPQQTEPLLFLSSALEARYDYSGNGADIEEAIQASQNALSLTQQDAPERIDLLARLASNHDSRFQRLGDMADIDVAISTYSEAMALMHEKSLSKASVYNDFGNALMRRFLHLGALEDLNRAIPNLENAVRLTPDQHPAKPSYYNNLGLTFRIRCEHMGNLDDFERAIANLEAAVKLTPNGHPNEPMHYSNLGATFERRFQKLGNLSDLEMAITNTENAVKLTPDGHQSKPSRYGNLGIALRSRFDNLGDLIDLEMAITHMENAMRLAPDGHPEKHRHYKILGSARLCRFKRLGVISDLEIAIINLESAVRLTPDGHPDKPWRCGGLADALRCRFDHLGDPADLERAITHMENAVRLVPDGHPEKHYHYSNLGAILLIRFKYLGVLADLEIAIADLESAGKLAPEGHPDKPLRYSHLSSALRLRFERLGDLPDIERAVINEENAMRLISDRHPDKASTTLSLAGCYESRFSSSGNKSDLEMAHFLYATAAQSPAGRPQERFNAALEWSLCAKRMDTSPLPAFKCAIDQLPRIAWLGIPVSEQHSLLEKIGGAVREAVAAAIEAEEYEMAVEWAEQGRSIAWQNLLKLRTPLDDLRAVDPQLANRLQSLSQQLDAPAGRELIPQPPLDRPQEEIAKSHTRLAIEWDELVDTIRKLPNFESFLKPKGFEPLAPAACEGPIVILNVSKDRCDALVLIPGDNEGASAVSIPLENFTFEKSQKLLQEMKSLLKMAGVRDGDTRAQNRKSQKSDPKARFKSTLRMLWVEVVKPVLDGLAYHPRATDLPRIWWCATGPLAFLPIHAAGDYDATEVGHKLSDYAVSSYTPTITAILDSSYPDPSKEFKLLTVAQPSAPNCALIPKTIEEVEKIAKVASGVSVVRLAEEEATMERVQRGIRESNWVHLACHGKQDTSKPLDSGLILRDGTLKLSEIIRENLSNAEFAFLSACQTAMGDEKVAEESVHLAAGMLLAGYRGVIATMWSIRDDDGPRVAEVVYGRMLKDGKPNRREAAYALHDAVKQLREEGADFTSWVPFIHIGR